MSETAPASSASRRDVSSAAAPAGSFALLTGLMPPSRAADADADGEGAAAAGPPPPKPGSSDEPPAVTPGLTPAAIIAVANTETAPVRGLFSAACSVAADR